MQRDVIACRFIEALNQRDLSGMLQLIADDCHHEDLSHEAQARNKEVRARCVRKATGVVTVAACAVLPIPSVGSGRATRRALLPTSFILQTAACLLPPLPSDATRLDDATLPPPLPSSPTQHSWRLAA